MADLHDPDLEQVHQALTIAVQSNTSMSNAISMVTTPCRLPWLGENILQEIAHRDWLNKRRRQARVTSEERALRTGLYRQQRNRVTTMIRRSRKRYVERMVQDAGGNQNRLWRVVRFVLKNDFDDERSRLPPELVLENG